MAHKDDNETENPGAADSGEVGWERADLVEGTSLWRDAFERLVRNRAAMGGLAVVVLMSIVAFFYRVPFTDFKPVPRYVTSFNLSEQHPFVSPKPPGARSVPSIYYELLPDDGKFAFETVDRDDNGGIDQKEIERAYRELEFRTIDTDGDGELDFREYRNAPLTMESPSGNVPDCERWEMLRNNMPPIRARSIFDCDAGDDGVMSVDEAGRAVQLVSSRESREILSRLDDDDSGEIERGEYAGLPQPETNWLGTDQLGRDVLTRLVYGARISLSVGILAALVSFFIGVIWGATAGFIGGVVDNIMMRIVDIMYGLPFMILVILLISVFGQSMLLLFVAIGAIRWLTMARIVRGQVISLKEKEFIEAAECIGVSNTGIIFKHLIPNALGPIIVYTTLMVPSVMLAEAFLSFLGLGIRAPYTSWGLLASEGREVMGSAPWILISAGAALAATLLSLNFLGDGLRDALDPQMKEHE